MDIFQVSENCILAKIANNKDVKLNPVMLSFCLDISASMRSPLLSNSNKTRWSYIVECVNKMIKFRQKTGHHYDMIQIVSYNTVATVIIPPTRLARINMNWHKIRPQNETDISLGYTCAFNSLRQFYTFMPKNVPKIIVHLDLTDGYPNLGLLCPYRLAKLRNNQILNLDKIGLTNIVCSYAISSASNEMIPKAAVDRIGSNRCIFRKLLDEEFEEFDGEIGIILGLCQNLSTFDYQNEKFYIVRSNDYNIFILEKKSDIENQNMSRIDCEILKNKNGKNNSILLNAMVDELKSPSIDERFGDVRTEYDCIWKNDLGKLRQYLKKNNMLHVFITTCRPSLEKILPFNSMLRAQSSASSSCKNISTDYTNFTEKSNSPLNIFDLKVDLNVL